MWGSIIGAVASLASSVVGAFSGSRNTSRMISAQNAAINATYEQQLAMNREDRQAQIDFAREDREWEYAHNLAMQQQAQNYQTNMSNTAHVREMQDLKNAGLNPILTINGGNGATTPNGTGGSGGDSEVSSAYYNYTTAQANMMNANTSRYAAESQSKQGWANTIANSLSNAANLAISAPEKLNNAKLLNAQTMLSETQRDQMASSARLNNSLALINEIDSVVHQATVPSRIKEQLTKVQGMAIDNIFKTQSTANLQAEFDKIQTELKILNPQALRANLESDYINKHPYGAQFGSMLNKHLGAILGIGGSTIGGGAMALRALKKRPVGFRY